MKTIYRIFSLAALMFLLTVCGFANEGNNLDKDLLANTEETIQVENWMTSLSEWNVEASDIAKSDYESELSVEDWMLKADDTNWKTITKVDTEGEMEVENWMSELSQW